MRAAHGCHWLLQMEDYQRERALAELNPGLPVGFRYCHAVLHDDVHGGHLLLHGHWTCTAMNQT